jgi:hypothetical protein
MIPAQQFTVWLVILAGAPAIFAAVLSFVGIILSRKIDAVHLQINSRMDELLAATKEAARSQGNVEGRAQAMVEQARDDKKKSS